LEDAVRKLVVVIVLLLMASLSGCSKTDSSSTPNAEVSAEQARAIAKEAYIYGFPMVDSYRVQYSYFVDKNNSEYKGDWNQIHNTARVATPADTALQTPNSDTPYSFLGADLRAEPLVLTVPPIDNDRFYSLQFIDGYTYNFDYVGTRTTGNAGGNYLLAGPGWTGDKPAGIDKVIRSETDLDFVLYRTQLFGPDDLDNVTKIQSQYQVQPLSTFLNQPAPPSAPPVDWITPLTADEQKTSPKFFEILNFALRFAPVLPSEQALRDRFATLGIGAGGDFNAEKLSPEMRAAVEAGMADAWAEFNTFKKDKVDTGQVTSGQVFGTREQLGDNYLYRMAGAVLGIYGNSSTEAMYPVLATDSDGAPLNGANNYTLRFAPGELPPVNAFWSVTMYKLPESLLVANPINRYLINSPMLPNLVKDPDGGLTIYIQNSSPGPEKEPNWLPSPPGPFTLYMRLYSPKPEALDGAWQTPKIVKAS
jgi:hypothetical protein